MPFSFCKRWLSMQQLTSEGLRLVNDLAQQHGFSPDAVTHMLFAVLNGNGSMAQFNHFEFGGAGQWMMGGMTMLGDMFNSGLKYRVDSLCYAISNKLAAQPGLLQSGSFQSQSQSGNGMQQQTNGTPQGASNLFVPDPRANWWPSELGMPNATGAQNNTRYAYFANARRLAVETGNSVWVYDTLDHQIGGFSQQQGSNNSIGFSSQYGTISLSALPVVMRDGQSVTAAPPAPIAAPVFNQPETTATQNNTDVFAALERLGDLKAKGILTDAEFAAKKAELLSRL